MSDFMSLFFMECSYFHIKNSLKTFQNIVYALIYAQQFFYHVFPCTHWSTHLHPSRATLVSELSRGGLIRGKFYKKFYARDLTASIDWL